MEAMDTEQLLDFCCEMGRELLRNGAEIYRVEDSVDRILAAYGYQEVEVFAIPSCIILNIRDETRNYAKAVRIRAVANNMDKLDRLNGLCRQVCQEKPEVEVAFARLQAIEEAPAYPPWAVSLAYGSTALFFTLFWGGHFLDALIAFACGLMVKSTVGYMRRVNANVFFTYVCASMLLMLPPVALAALGAGIHTDMVVIGAIMLLVPGLAITNMMRDVITGDFLTALTRFAEVMIVAMAIAIGIAIPYGIARVWFGI